jgi:hypothetical protein
MFDNFSDSGTQEGDETDLRDKVPHILERLKPSEKRSEATGGSGNPSDWRI